MNPSPLELLATTFFALAVMHTFMVKRFESMADRCPDGSVRGTLLHFLAETEVVFGLWAAALFLGLAAMQQSGLPPRRIIEIWDRRNSMKEDKDLEYTEK